MTTSEQDPSEKLEHYLPGPEAHAFGDPNPGPNEPNLDIWPIGDPGDWSGDPDDLILITNSFPEPHIRWVTPDQYDRKYGHPPRGPPIENFSREVQRKIRQAKQTTMTQDRLTAFERISRLWNGEAVTDNNLHLLLDPLPSWTDLTHDLSGLDALTQTVKHAHPDLIDAFGHFDWFDTKSVERSYLKPTTILRRKRPYDIDEKGRTLITERDDLPDLKGDPHEGLLHRFTVGTAATYIKFNNDGTPRTYPTYGPHRPDLLDEANGVIWEVLTNHNNNQLHRKTLKKIYDLNLPAVLVFENRDTACRVLTHLAAKDLLDLEFRLKTRPNMTWIRKKVKESFADNSLRWPIQDIHTTTTLYNTVFNPDSRQPPSRHDVLRLNW